MGYKKVKATDKFIKPGRFEFVRIQLTETAGRGDTGSYVHTSEDLSVFIGVRFDCLILVLSIQPPKPGR